MIGSETMPHKKPIILAGATVVVLLAAAWTADRLVSGNGTSEYTNDAYVTADFTTVAPKVPGRIDRVIAQDNEAVHPGEELAHIEDEDYRAALETATGEREAAQGDVANLEAELVRQSALIAQARASVSADQAQLVFAQQNARRYHNLAADGSGTLEQNQDSAARLLEAQARLDHDNAAVEAETDQVAVLRARLLHAQGALEQARGREHTAALNLSYCTIPAPVEGVVGERGVRVGAYVHAGTALLAVVPTQAAYVLANFQETQLTHVRTGQRATIWVDTFPGHPLHAHVDSLAPATGVAFAPIQPDNATGNFTKVVQRIPVKLVFDPGQNLAGLVRVGMSVEARIDTVTPPDGPHATEARYAWQ
ncbi:multidrug resistance efflux pump HlyD [Komagataeibacter intermedius TF2]|uniref:Multidrug resistance efflux pump n=3 Tax=Komagataeibacter intermedius TaxID=66229 RepID=A0A0N0MEC3_9PROT|nr:Multidrug resistance efflux pump [Komagataeibacter intermedius AF2]GAN86101.1 multidrug resistance efflux pump HlyD [Komagataeibacter intermedius TF2]GBQ69194.1 major facilitator superfamily multidrug resistance transporter HlyD/EmrA/FusE [Komagataeibacter intermedius NRIC 0521]